MTRSGQAATAAPVAPASRAAPARPIAPVTFVAVAVSALGGPLALAALYAPGVLADVTGSAGMVALAGTAAFAFPLWIWLRYARTVAGPAGLAGFVEHAAGRRTALVQGAVWTLSYLLYVCYTGAYVVYDVLPAVFPGFTPYRWIAEVLLPVAVAATVLAPRRFTLAVIAVIAVGQVGLSGWLGVRGLVGGGAVAAFAPRGSAGPLAEASGNLALLYVCGSLPVFLGGEVAHPTRTVRRGLVLAYGLVALLVTLAVLPLARTPAVAGEEIPGMLLASAYGGRLGGVAVGLGVVASIVGVMLVEYVALTRLLHGMAGWRIRSVTRGVAGAVVAAGPVSLLVGPQTFYAALLRPSLVALWISQLIVVAVWPLFVRRHGRVRAVHVGVTLGAGVLMLFGLYSSLVHQVLT